MIFTIIKRRGWLESTSKHMRLGRGNISATYLIPAVCKTNCNKYCSGYLIYYLDMLYRIS